MICPVCRGTMRWNNERFACPVCGYDDTPKPKPQTNADRIRSMADDELAEFIAKVQRAGAYGRDGAVFDYIDLTQDEVTLWLDWLKQEAT